MIEAFAIISFLSAVTLAILFWQSRKTVGALESRIEGLKASVGFWKRMDENSTSRWEKTLAELAVAEAKLQSIHNLTKQEAE